MKVSTKQHFGLLGVLLVTCVIVVSVLWAHNQVTQTTRHLTESTALLRSLSELRLISAEYAVRPTVRGLAQWNTVSDRLNSQLQEESAARGSPEIYADLRRRRVEVVKAFTELQSVSVSDTDLRQLIFSHILILQQENFSAAYRMMDKSTARINQAQRLAVNISLLGLTLIALANVVLSAVQHWQISKPLQRLQTIARRVAAGESNVPFDFSGNDEISLLSQDLEDMSTAQRRMLIAQMEVSGRLESLNEELESFSYSVSHDLRGPLRSMDGFSLCLLEDYADKLDADGVDALQRIRAASQRMGVLIDDVLALSKITRSDLKMNDVDVSGMTRQIAADLDAEQSGAVTSWDIADNMSIRGDKQLLKLALVNLLSNAKKFSSKNPAPIIQVDLCEREEIQCVRVRDNGVGFDMAYAHQLFGAFKRLHHVNDFPGTGIGLAIVQRVIHRHGGEVFANSEAGKGAEFYFHTGRPNHDYQ